MSQSATLPPQAVQQVRQAKHSLQQQQQQAQAQAQAGYVWFQMKSSQGICAESDVPIYWPTCATGSMMLIHMFM